jgi:hypothetical protein
VGVSEWGPYAVVAAVAATEVVVAAMVTAAARAMSIAAVAVALVGTSLVEAKLVATAREGEGMGTLQVVVVEM